MQVLEGIIARAEGLCERMELLTQPAQDSHGDMHAYITKALRALRRLTDEATEKNGAEADCSS